MFAFGKLDLFNDISKEVNVEKIEKSMDKIRARFGKESICKLKKFWT